MLQAMAYCSPIVALLPNQRGHQVAVIMLGALQQPHQGQEAGHTTMGINLRFNLKVIEGTSTTPVHIPLNDAVMGICAGCGEIKDVEDMSEFICCDKMFCPQCSCSCPVFDIDDED